MQKRSKSKIEAMERLSDKNHIIDALAIDQRGSLKKMIAAHTDKPVSDEMLENFKVEVSKELTKYASSILLDPEYGLPAAKARNKNAGLLLAYEKTGYDATIPGRLPDLLDNWSARRLKEAGADAVKFLLYYDVDEDPAINERKHVFMERVGSECLAEDIPFFLEIVTYDAGGLDLASPEFAKVKPHKVIDAMKEFSKEAYHIDVLKMEVPVNMAFVKGYGTGSAVYTKEEAKNHFKAQSDATALPFIFLSAGVDADVFLKTLELAGEAGSSFNGVLCGRATWKHAVQPYAEKGAEACLQWLSTEGRKNIEALDAVLQKTAQPWSDKLSF